MSIREMVAITAMLLYIGIALAVLVDGAAYYLTALPAWFLAGYIGTGAYQRWQEARR